MLGNKISELRKAKGITQEILASFLGVTMQAVSKWENDSCCPDIYQLPAIADYFNVTIDALFGRANTSVPLNLPIDNKLRIIQCRDGMLLKDNEWEKDVAIKLAISEKDIPEKVLALEVWGNCEVDGDINGNVSAGDGINCNNIDGNASAGDGINCNNIGGDVSAGDGINCNNIGGDVSAGDGINCSNIDGEVSAGDGINCGNISGNATAGDSLNCGDIGGNATSGADLTCDNIEGNAKCEGNLECGSIVGDVTCKGNIYYK